MTSVPKNIVKLTVVIQFNKNNKKQYLICFIEL